MLIAYTYTIKYFYIIGMYVCVAIEEKEGDENIIKK
jgi:hypothetical protein